MEKEAGKKLKNIEFLRFVFAGSIVYFHLLHSALMPYTDNAEIYQCLAEQSKYTKYIVECFFIISGYFLYQSMVRHPEKGLGRFVWGKIARLWPVLACATLISVIFMKKSVYSAIINLCFLQSTSLAIDWKGLNWYVSAFFFAEIFYFMLYKAVRNAAARRLIVCLIVYFGYSLNLMTTNGEFGRKVVYGVFSLAIARALAGVGLGCLIGEAYKTFACGENHLKIVLSEKWRIFLVSVLETGSFLLLLYDFFGGKNAPQNQFLVVVCFSVLFVCMLTEKGILSKIISRSRLCRMGKYAYSIYVMQETAFLLLKRTLWKNSVFVQRYAALCLGISVLAAVVLGIIIYYLVERPAGEKMAGLVTADNGNWSRRQKSDKK